MKRLIIILMLTLLGPNTAFGITDSDWAAIVKTDSTFYNANDGDLYGICSTATPLPAGGGTTPPGATQIANAKVVIGISKTLNLGRQGALIGLMTGLAESSLHNHASNAVPISLTFPHDDVPPGDHDSVGVFQQRAGGSWGPYGSGASPQNVEKLMTPSYAAEAFFAMPEGKKEPKAMVKIPNWQTMDPGAVAQAVQQSAFPDAYNRQKANAQKLMDDLYDSTAPIPLPVPLASQGGGPPISNVIPGNSCASGAANGPVTGCINPFVEGHNVWRVARTDQGVDYMPTKTVPVRAICDGIITASDTGTGWGGSPGGWISYKLTSGPKELIGKCIFVAEQVKGSVTKGQKVKAGEQIGEAYGLPVFTEWGWTQYPTHNHEPSTPYNGAADGTSMPGGKAFARFLRALGAKTQQDPGPGPYFEGAVCP